MTDAAEAVKKAEADAQNPHPMTENGAGVDSTASAVQSKLRGGLAGTEAALGILGAGKPYAPGTY